VHGKTITYHEERISAGAHEERITAGAGLPVIYDMSIGSTLLTMSMELYWLELVLSTERYVPVPRTCRYRTVFILEVSAR